jgi:DNA uptake protein ComE-like DNA-binding protein
MASKWLAAFIMMGAISMVGCVSHSKYEDAMGATDLAKSELALARAQRNALEQQVKTLKDLNMNFGNEAQVAHDEVARLQHDHDKERGGVESRTKELEAQMRLLAAKNWALRQKYGDVKQQNDMLKSLEARYQKELRDQSRSVTGAPAPSVSPDPLVASVPPAMKDLQPMPSSMNVNTASAGDMVLGLGLSKDVADRIVTNRPYRVKGELLAKQVVSKETFDGIKERINVSP